MAQIHFIPKGLLYIGELTRLARLARFTGLAVSLCYVYIRRSILVRATDLWGKRASPPSQREKLPTGVFLVGFDLLAWTNLLNFMASNI